MNDLKLERYLAGDLSAAEMQELANREKNDDLFHARCEELRKQNESIVNEYPFYELEERLEPNVIGVATQKLRFYKMAIAAAFVFTFGSVAMFALFEKSGETVVMPAQVAEVSATQNVAMVDTRIKGMSARLEIWRKNGTGIEQLADNSVAHENDELQLRYLVPEKCFGMLFSMDGNGTLTLHLGNNNEAIELEPGKMISLPFAYKLDNAPHFEKFFLLTSRNAFGVVNNDVDATLGQDGIEVTAITLAKQGGN